MDANERIDGIDARFFSDTLDEEINANLEPLHAQTTVSTEMMDRLIGGHSPREFMAASTHDFRQLSESPFAEAPRSYRFPSVAPLATTGYSPDNGLIERSLRDTDQ